MARRKRTPTEVKVVRGSVKRGVKKGARYRVLTIKRLPAQTKVFLSYVGGTGLSALTISALTSNPNSLYDDVFSVGGMTFERVS